MTRVKLISSAILTATALAITLLGEQPTGRPKGLPQDWSTRHVLFTNGTSPEMAASAQRDPRYWINWMLRGGNSFRWPALRQSTWALRFRRDWAMSLGPGAGGTGGMPVGETPAKFSFDINGAPNCANDFVVFTIDATPGTGQANIVAFNNLYTGATSSFCPFGPQAPPTTDYTQPTFMWSYQVGTGPAYLSPALSLDGTKVAFVEGANPALFDVLTWVSGQGTDATHPAAPGTGGSSVASVDYTNTTVAGCTANPATDSNSSAYIDYVNDAAYVGADNGVLYRISGVFNGVPTLQYCVTVSAGNLLTSPVYDSVNNVVFVSDGFSVYGYTPGTTGFTAAGSIVVASAAGNDPIVLSPVVDTTNGFVYVFSRDNANNRNSIVSQINTALTSQNVAVIGRTSNQYILDGDFDNAYFTNGPTTGAGTLYACGTDANNAAKPSLYALSFQAPTGAMNAAPAMADNRNINGATNPNGMCSPLLDFYDGTNDRLFVGAGAAGATTGANLVTEWNVNTRIASNATKPNNAAAGYWGGTSAFSIDNVSTEPQAASIYFGTLSPPPGGTTTPCGAGNYCAVKLTQSALQ